MVPCDHPEAVEPAPSTQRSAIDAAAEGLKKPAPSRDAFTFSRPDETTTEPQAKTSIDHASDYGMWIQRAEAEERKMTGAPPMVKDLIGKRAAYYRSRAEASKKSSMLATKKEEEDRKAEEDRRGSEAAARVMAAYQRGEEPSEEDFAQVPEKLIPTLFARGEAMKAAKVKAKAAERDLDEEAGDPYLNSLIPGGLYSDQPEEDRPLATSKYGKELQKQARSAEAVTARQRERLIAQGERDDTYRETPEEKAAREKTAKGREAKRKMLERDVSRAEAEYLKFFTASTSLMTDPKQLPDITAKMNAAEKDRDAARKALDDFDDEDARSDKPWADDPAYKALSPAGKAAWDAEMAAKKK